MADRSKANQTVLTLGAKLGSLRYTASRNHLDSTVSEVSQPLSFLAIDGDFDAG